MANPLPASCLCGEVKFSATPQRETMSACHCDMCRKWTGGVYMSTDCSGTVKFEDESKLGHIKMSQWGERIFCPSCGSSLVWQTQDGKLQMVSVSAFNEMPDLRFALEVYHDCKPENYSFANETKKMTEAEIQAMFAPIDGASS